MKILIFTPGSRDYKQAEESRLNLTIPDGVQVAWYRDNSAVHLDRYDEITRKYEDARLLALAGNYDYMFCVEDDIIIPSDALVRLLACDAGIAYGLATWRNSPHRWSATIDSDGDDHIVTLDMMPDLASKHWGEAVETPGGCGLMCTLIRRGVLERFSFQRRGRHCCDWYLAQDVDAAGIKQVTDTGVICGHIMSDYKVVWPISQPPYHGVRDLI